MSRLIDSSARLTHSPLPLPCTTLFLDAEPLNFHRTKTDISQIKEPIHQETQAVDGAIVKQDDRILEELFLPGTQYFLRREIDEGNSDNIVNVKSKEFYTLWRRNPGDHFRRILLSGNLISDHKCENHYYALRDVLKGLPASGSRTNF